MKIIWKNSEQKKNNELFIIWFVYIIILKFKMKTNIILISVLLIIFWSFWIYQFNENKSLKAEINSLKEIEKNRKGYDDSLVIQRIALLEENQSFDLGGKSEIISNFKKDAKNQNIPLFKWDTQYDVWFIDKETNRVLIYENWFIEEHDVLYSANSYIYELKTKKILQAKEFESKEWTGDKLIDMYNSLTHNL